MVRKDESVARLPVPDTSLAIARPSGRRYAAAAWHWRARRLWPDHSRRAEKRIKHDQFRAVIRQLVQQLGVQPAIPRLPARLVELIERRIVHQDERDLVCDRVRAKAEQIIVAGVDPRLARRRPHSIRPQSTAIAAPSADLRNSCCQMALTFTARLGLKTEFRENPRGKQHFATIGKKNRLNRKILERLSVHPRIPMCHLNRTQPMNINKKILKTIVITATIGVIAFAGINAYSDNPAPAACRSCSRHPAGIPPDRLSAGRPVGSVWIKRHLHRHGAEHQRLSMAPQRKSFGRTDQQQPHHHQLRHQRRGLLHMRPFQRHPKPCRPGAHP